MPTKTINDLTNTPNILDGDELAFWNLANSRTDKISYLDLKADLLGTASDTEILFMDGTNIAGDSRITYNNSTNVFSLLGNMVGATVDDFTNTVHADGVHKQIRNESGGGLVKGDLVHASGFSIGQDLVLVKKADASSTATMPVMGVITESIANNASGGALESGRISGVDTSSFSVGDILFATTTPGVFGTRPTNSTDIVQSIGVVLRSHASLGEIEVEGAGRINTPPNLLDAAMWIGDASNFPVPRVISGDITISNLGVADISSGVVGDAEIGIHTSTKITITDKSQLNSAIVYTDQANTYDAFAQIFPSTQFQLNNPANTSQYIFTGSAIAADRAVTLPLLTAPDTFVMESFASTLTNKTFDSTSNVWRTSGTTTLTADVTITSGNLIFTPSAYVASSGNERTFDITADITGQTSTSTFAGFYINILDAARASSGVANAIQIQNDSTDVFRVGSDGSLNIDIPNDTKLEFSAATNGSLEITRLGSPSGRSISILDGAGGGMSMIYNVSSNTSTLFNLEDTNNIISYDSDINTTTLFTGAGLRLTITDTLITSTIDLAMSANNLLNVSDIFATTYKTGETTGNSYTFTAYDVTNATHQVWATITADTTIPTVVLNKPTNGTLTITSSDAITTDSLTMAGLLEMSGNNIDLSQGDILDVNDITADRLLIVNAGAGGNPIIFSNQATQILDIAGGVDVVGDITTSNGNITFLGTGALGMNQNDILNVGNLVIQSDGTVSDPVLRIGQDADGFYRSGINELSVSINNVQVAKYNTTTSNPLVTFIGNSAGDSEMVLENINAGAAANFRLRIRTPNTGTGDAMVTMADSGNSGSIGLNGGDGEFQIAFGSTLSSAQIRIASATMAFFNTTPASQPAHIVDADGSLADITTKFNTLLAQQASLGLQASS